MKNCEKEEHPVMKSIAHSFIELKVLQLSIDYLSN